MITSTDIGTLIQNPNAVLNYSSKDLEEIRNKYPYCATLHLLYLKSISLTNDLQFEDHLRFSAAHIIDREQMYYLIHSGENDPIKPEVAEERTEVSVTTSEKAETVKPETQNIVVNASLAVELTKPVAEEIPNLVDIEKKTESFAIEETDSEEISTTKELLDSAPDLVDMAYESDLADESAIEIAKIESKTEIPEISKSETVEVKSEVKEIADPILTEAPADLSNLSFVEWLKYKQNKTSPVQIDSIPEKLEIKTEQPISSTVDTKAEEIKKAKKSGLSRFDVDALLNKFIKEEPSISRPQADFYNPVKNAKQSLEESPDLVTETLAKIYVLQKNYSKALQAYEQLSLVYPEKKTFFATQIKKIKEEQLKQSKQ
ncbi:MAG: hypothetical protein IPO32_04180 [Crocinitomicaceae bacterium]|nr:hypothetical protein [Crocinitomicaceae bacterium]